MRRYLYRGRHRRGKFSRTVEDIKRDLNRVYFATGQGEITIPPWATGIYVGGGGGAPGGGAANWHSGYGGTWGITRITNNRRAA